MCPGSALEKGGARARCVCAGAICDFASGDRRLQQTKTKTKYKTKGVNMKITIMVNRASMRASKGVKEAKAVDYTIVNVQTGETVGNALLRTKGLEGLELKKGDALSVIEVASGALKAGHTATARTRQMVIDLETSKAYMDYIKAVDRLESEIKGQKENTAQIIWELDRGRVERLAKVNNYLLFRASRTGRALSEGIIHMLGGVKVRMLDFITGGVPINSDKVQATTARAAAGEIATEIVAYRIRAARRAAASARKAALQAAVDIISKQGYIAG